MVMFFKMKVFCICVVKNFQLFFIIIGVFWIVFIKLKVWVIDLFEVLVFFMIFISGIFLVGGKKCSLM